jgi:serine/threonine protein kinase
MEAPLPIAPPTVGDYTLGPLLGRGGMSEVYACTHATHGAVALKLLRDDADGAFHVEAATREVVHPNVVRVIDAGIDAATQRKYIVMQRLGGPDLATHLATRPLDEAAARVLFAQIADGMHAVHTHGIVHRDLKPANVMLHAGTPRVVDFGIAKLLGDNAALVTSRRIGTLGYMAPEQLVGGKIAPSVDVWALGVMLFEAVAGRLPFDGFTESYTPQLVETAPRTSSLAQVSPAYDALVAACLEPDPVKRPPMAYLARALRGEVAVTTSADERVTQDIGAMPAVAPAPIGAMPGIVTSVAPPPIAAPVRPRSRRKRGLVWAIAAMSIGTMVFAAATRGSASAPSSNASTLERPTGTSPPVERPTTSPLVERPSTSPPVERPTSESSAITLEQPAPVVEAPRTDPPKRITKKRAKAPARKQARRETLD